MKNFKKVLCLSLALAMVFTLAACGCSKKASSDNDDKTLVVGFDSEFPPYGFEDENGDYTGFDLDLAAAVAKELGMEVIYQPIDWDSKDAELESGTIDCIWNGFTINGREDDYTWSDAYLNNQQVVVVRSDSGIKSAADLKGKIVEVQKDSSAEAALDEKENKQLKASFKEVVTVADYNTALMDLESGAVNAVIMDSGVAEYKITSEKKALTVLEGSIADEQYAIGFKKGNTELRDQVNDALIKLVKSGEVAKISNKWFGKDVVIIGK